METKSIVAIIILVILLAGIIFSMYFIFEKPEKEKEIIFKNVFFMIKNNDTKESLNENIIINVDGSRYKNITSQIGSFILAKVPINKSIGIHVDIPDYYEFFDNLFFDENLTNDRYIIKLNKKGNITMDYNLLEKEIHMNFYKDGVIKNPVMCIDYSNKFIYFKSKDYSIKNGKINDEYKCFFIGEDFTEKDNILNFNYFGELTKDDYLNIRIYDEDGGKNELLFEKKISFT